MAGVASARQEILKLSILLVQVVQFLHVPRNLRDALLPIETHLVASLRCDHLMQDVVL